MTMTKRQTIWREVNRIGEEFGELVREILGKKGSKVGFGGIMGEEKKTLGELIVSAVEEDTRLLFSEGFSKLLRGYVDLPAGMEEEIGKNLDDFAESVSGKPMDRKTRRFLVNELIYIALILKRRME